MSIKEYKPPRVRAWMLGYYAAMQDTNNAPQEISLEDLSWAYKDSLSKRADKETRFLVNHMKNHKKLTK